MHEDTEMGIESISFFVSGDNSKDKKPIKISRGEERIFLPFLGKCLKTWLPS